MLNKLQIDLKRRSFFYINELNTRLLKILSNNNILSIKNRWIFFLKISKLNKNSFISKVHNFCVITGRPKAIFKNLKISRIIFRNKASFHKLVGIQKVSW
jgi:small subunit ribosomal protein S14